MAKQPSTAPLPPPAAVIETIRGQSMLVGERPDGSVVLTVFGPGCRPVAIDLDRQSKIELAALLEDT